MCLIAHSTSAFRELSSSFWETACRANPHGLGLMWHDGRELHVETHLDYDADFLLERLRQSAGAYPVAVHLREATFGARCRGNLHPHVLELREPSPWRLAMMHNGSVPAMAAEPDAGPSDSALLLSEWIQPRVAGSEQPWYEGTLLTGLEAYLPERNRLVLVDSAGHWRIVREHEGFWRGQTWLSNPKAKPWV